MTTYNTTLGIVDTDYAWSECSQCGNTVKFGGGQTSSTVCPACGTRHTADRATATVETGYIPTDEELWAEEDAYLDD